MMEPSRSIDSTTWGAGRSPSFAIDGIECSKVDRPHRLGAEHERIVSQTFAINVRFHGKITKAVEAGFGFGFYAAIKEMDSCKVARILQRGPQSKSAPGTAVIILRGPVIAPAADRRQRDRIVADQRIGLQTLSKCREVAQR